jgi:hypothetical protein
MSEQLPATKGSAFAEAAAQNHQEVAGHDAGFLKFNGKSGQWTFGPDDVDVDNAIVLIQSRLIQQGFIRWGTKPPVKVFSFVASGGMPEAPAPHDGTDQDGNPATFTAQPARQFVGMFCDEDKDLGQFNFNTSSTGGVENVAALYTKIIQKASTSDFFYPMVMLKDEWYKRSTGKVFKPVFEVLKWCDENGVPEGETKQLASDTESGETEQKEEQPKRRRRRA